MFHTPSAGIIRIRFFGFALRCFAFKASPTGIQHHPGINNVSLYKAGGQANQGKLVYANRMEKKN